MQSHLAYSMFVVINLTLKKKLLLTSNLNYVGGKKQQYLTSDSNIKFHIKRNFYFLMRRQKIQQIKIY